MESKEKTDHIAGEVTSCAEAAFCMTKSSPLFTRSCSKG